jgi:PncC family amidohydrolase
VYSETLNLYASLRRFEHRLVLAESCTAGLVAAELGGIPGVSNCLCGSLVVYRNDSKIRWAGIEPAVLEDPNVGPVSDVVTAALAQSALQRTPEATLSGAITGHLGPGSPEHLDGIVYCAVAVRNKTLAAICKEYRLSSPSPKSSQDIAARCARQTQAAKLMIMTLIEFLEVSNIEHTRHLPTNIKKGD